MRVVMRTDAASHIGIGHVMRCLTLANVLQAKGAEVSFVCRPFAGDLAERIIAEGHRVHLLPPAMQAVKLELDLAQTPPYAAWLGESWETDLAQTRVALDGKVFDWLIVDHYSLDSRWESAMRKISRKIMVIDDLADRMHDCDLLLDQTLGRNDEEYKSWVPKDCTLLTGSNFALLRPEFAELRDYSLRRRAKPKMEQLLVSMGGVDQFNATGQLLEALQHSSLPPDCRIIVVMSDTSPWLDKVREQAKKLIQPTEVMVKVSDMAQLMADSDLSIGAAGSTSWERCCLGLPTLMVILAENQRGIGLVLEQEQAVILLKEIFDVKKAIGLLCDPTKKLSNMSQAARNVTDGSGAGIVLSYMEQLCA